MYVGTYVGPVKDGEISLFQKTALLRDDEENPDNYLAQFDDTSLTFAFGWWVFPKKGFTDVRKLEDR
jgi:hypothetical protein